MIKSDSHDFKAKVLLRVILSISLAYSQTNVIFTRIKIKLTRFSSPNLPKSRYILHKQLLYKGLQYTESSCDFQNNWTHMISIQKFKSRTARFAIIIVSHDFEGLKPWLFAIKMNSCDLDKKGLRADSSTPLPIETVMRLVSIRFVTFLEKDNSVFNDSSNPAEFY